MFLTLWLSQQINDNVGQLILSLFIGCICKCYSQSIIKRD